MIKSRYKWINDNKNLNTDIDIEKRISINLKPLIKKLLIARNIDSDEKVNKFLYGSISDLYDPFLIKDMDKATDRIIKAIKNKEKITIYGDYDVDGISSTTVLYSYLKRIGCDINYYIPLRQVEGYGLNKNALKKIAESETSLIITVDTGITAINEVEFAKTLGMDVVITDHHECASSIPDAIAIVDSKREDDSYPFSELAGVGTAFKLICALNIILMQDEMLKDDYKKLDIDIYEYLEIVCLGTISDIVTLQDENRIIVKEGMKRLVETKNVGLKALLSATLGNNKNFTARDIAFMLVPKLNAVGRIDDAKIGVELFMEKDEETAKLIVKDLLKKNEERKKCEQEIFDSAIEIIEKDEHYKDEKVLIVKNNNWHHGVIGIVASRLAETYFKPVIIFNEDNNMLSGSARTMGGVNIYEVIDKARSILYKFGGHEGAAGLSLELKNFEEFRKIILDYANENITDDLLMPYINVDMEINPDDIDIETINELKLLEPFGAGNEEPIFKINAKVVNATLMGKNNEHLRLKLKGDNNAFDCVGFFKSNIYENLNIDKNFLILGTLSINEFNGTKKAQVMLNDIKSNMVDIIDSDYFKSLYEKIKYEIVEDILNNDKEELLKELSNSITEKNKLDNNDLNNNDLNNNDLIVINDINKLFDEIEKVKFINSNIEKNVEKYKKILFVVNNKNDLEEIMNTYENDISLYYEKISDIEYENSIIKQGKKLIILSNNIQKLVDLRKNYTIIYYDSLETYNFESLHASFCISKEEVASVYKRIMYLIKINTNEIYIDDLLYNLKGLNTYKILISLEILQELGIMNYNLSKEDKVIFSINKDVKNAIENSKIYNIIRKG